MDFGIVVRSAPIWDGWPKTRRWIGDDASFGRLELPITPEIDEVLPERSWRYGIFICPHWMSYSWLTCPWPHSSTSSFFSFNSWRYIISAVIRVKSDSWSRHSRQRSGGCHLQGKLDWWFQAGLGITKLAMKIEKLKLNVTLGSIHATHLTSWYSRFSFLLKSYNRVKSTSTSIFPFLLFARLD